MQRLMNWLDARTGYRTLMHEALYERVPGGARWRYVWGSTLVYTFTVQMITGFFLWTAYSPSAQTAWESVYYIQYVMQAGWLVRGIHHFTAQAMIVLMAIHLMQVIIDGAYQAPREINFWLGLVLMQIVLGLSLTGYLLPWDQKGYWATQVATNIMGISPGVGPEVQKLASGGVNYGHATLTRFFALHAGLLPALLVGFLALHIYVFRRHGITVPDPKRAPDTTFWPDQVLKDAIACLAVLATVLVLTLWKGAELTAPADPSEQFSAARPEWYFLFLFQFLKYFKGTLEVVGAIYIPGAIMLVLVLMPFIGRTKFGHRLNVFFMFAVLLGAGALTVVAIREDQQDPNYAAAVHDAEVQAKRVQELAQSPQGIGVAGAIQLLRQDPKTQGGKLFAKNCAVCHRYDGKDGTGKEVQEMQGDKLVASIATATDLGNFGSREWVTAVIKNFGKHIEPTTHARFDGQEIKDRFTAGDMATWSKENGSELKPDDLSAIVEFIVDQSGTANPPTNPELVKQGREFFANGNDQIQESCGTCHKLQPRGEMKALGGGSEAPDLTGYGSEQWLSSFISNPGDKRHYGKKNAMPDFADRLSDQERKLLIDWMQHKWYEPATAAKH